MENENLYNTHFCVKYKSIKQELLMKCDCQNDCDYSKQDVYDVCSKLYRDEYASVFYSNHILDDKIDESLLKLYELFCLNPDFQDCISKMMDTMNVVNEEDNEKSHKYFCFLSLFSEDLFYLTHTFVCDFLNTKTVNKKLFEKMFEEWNKPML